MDKRSISRVIKTSGILQKEDSLTKVIKERRPSCLRISVLLISSNSLTVEVEENIQNHKKVNTVEDNQNDATNSGERNKGMSTKDKVTKSFRQLTKAASPDILSHEESVKQEENKSNQKIIATAPTIKSSPLVEYK